MMFMNLHTLPAGQSLFTVYVTNDPEGTPRSETYAEEIDVLAPSHCRSWGAINVNGGTVNGSDQDAQEYMLETYGHEVRVVGVVNQSTGDIVFDAFLEG